MDDITEKPFSPDKYWRSFAPEPLRKCIDFGEYLRTFFHGRFGQLSLIDLATGNGQFPLSLVKKKEQLGLRSVTASDRDTTFMEKSGNRLLLEQKGVIIECLDITQVVEKENLMRVLWGDPIEELPDSSLYDVVCLNAPYIEGKRGFFDQALAYAIHITKPGGLIFISLNEIGGETIMNEMVPKKYPIQKIDDLNGYPSTKFTETQPFTKRKCPVYIILKS